MSTYEQAVATLGHQKAAALDDLQHVYDEREDLEHRAIRAARECIAQGISAAEAARHVGVDRSTISRLYARARGWKQ